MAPEQKLGMPADERTDLYALGLILRDMLLGQLKPSGAEVNPLIDTVLERLLAEHPDERFASATEARLALEQLKEHPEISVHSRTPHSAAPGVVSGGRRRQWLLGAAVVIVAVAAMAYIVSQRDETLLMNPEARVFYNRGLHYLNEELGKTKSLDDAIQMFHRAENLDSDSALIMSRLASAYWFRFRKTRSTASRAEAERYIAKAHLLDPELPELAYARGLGLFNEGKYDGAKAEFEKAVAGRPDLAYAWAYLGATFKNLGEYAAGIEAHDRAMELDSGSYSILVFRGAFHQHFSEHEEALRYYRKATELKPDSNVAWTNLGATLLYTGRPEEATAAFLRSIKIEDDAEARTNLGTAYYFLGRFEDSVEHYLVATVLQPKRAVYWGNLGDAYLALERADEAREVYGKAAEVARERVELEQLNPEARQRLALYCGKAGDEACALENGAMLVELQPDSAHANLTYAAIHCMLGRDDECLEWLQKAVALGASKSEIEAAPELARLEDSPRFQEIMDLR
jgi:tetratricopeptide (TPR) repeat protein